MGAPPGYVGYEEGGQLTEHVRRKPYSVVLFDEIEKAHPDVFNAMLQILEDGRLTDGQGRTVNFRNAVIVMTSNVGSSTIHEMGPIGFSVNARNGDEGVRSKLLDALRRTFKPEFLNRVDDIIVFNPLNREHLAQIIGIQLSRVVNLTEAARHASRDHRAHAAFWRKNFDPAYGARRRAIQRLIRDPRCALAERRFVSGDDRGGRRYSEHALSFVKTPGRRPQ
jgi:ATP-dependent Clp protease ATP-binding subunit ClpC